MCDIENTSEHHDFTFSLAYEKHCSDGHGGDEHAFRRHGVSGSGSLVIKARSKLLCTMRFPRRSISRVTSAVEMAQFLESELRSRLCLKWVLQQTRTGRTQLSNTTTITGKYTKASLMRLTLESDDVSDVPAVGACCVVVRGDAHAVSACRGNSYARVSRTKCSTSKTRCYSWRWWPSGRSRHEPQHDVTSSSSLRTVLAKCSL